MEQFLYRGPDKKVSKAVSEKLPSLSYSYFRKLLRKGDIRINGTRTKEDVLVSDGDEVKVYCEEKKNKPVPVFRDGFVCVFNKPIGISSEDFAVTVRENYGEKILCHRLDTNTCGLLVFAENAATEQAVREAFSAHKIEKHYYAEVFGLPPKNFSYTDYLTKIPSESRVVVRSQPTEGSVKILTKGRVLEQKGEITALDIELVTGKTHQIRAHMAYRGFPLVGDGKYGSEEKNRRAKTHVQHLCAYKLIFHTDTGILASLNGKTVFIPPKSY